MAARSKAWVCGHSLAGIVGCNLAGGMDVCVIVAQTYTYVQEEIFTKLFLISNFRLVLNVVCFLLGNSLASEFCMPTFRSTLSVPSS